MYFSCHSYPCDAVLNPTPLKDLGLVIAKSSVLNSLCCAKSSGKSWKLTISASQYLHPLLAHTQTGLFHY